MWLAAVCGPRGRRLQRGATLAFLIGTVGCSSLPPPKYPIADAQQLLLRHELTSKDVQGIRAEARVDQRGAEGRVRGTVLMFVERTGRVRFDVMTQFGPIAILTSDGARFAYSDLRQTRYMTGETCPRNIARLLGVPLSAQDTAHFLLGGTPVIEFRTSALRWNDDGYYTATLTGARGERQELDFELDPSDRERPASEQRLSLLRTELYDASGDRVWRVSYADLRRVDGGSAHVRMPFSVRVEQTASRSDTLVRFKEIKVNPAFRDEIFVQSPSPSMQQEEASCD
jgi:hypothetical protein